MTRDTLVEVIRETFREEQKRLETKIDANHKEAGEWKDAILEKLQPVLVAQEDIVLAGAVAGWMARHGRKLVWITTAAGGLAAAIWWPELVSLVDGARKVAGS